MKKLMIILSMLVLITAVPFNATAQIVDATAVWTQSDYDTTDYWILYWGAASGGPYEDGNITVNKAELINNETKKDINVYFPDGVSVYYFVIVAFNAQGNSPDSNEFAFSIAQVPEAPFGLQVNPR